MVENASRVAGGVLMLLGLWVAVYWAWPSEPGVSLASADVGPGVQPPIDRVEPVVVPPPVEARAEGPRAGPGPEPARVVMQPPEFIEHRVAKGETFGSIARRYYGSATLATAIARANPLIDPTRLREGRVIRVPKDPRNIQGRPVTVPAGDPRAEGPAVPSVPPPVSPGPTGGGEVRTYTVQRGDTLSAISKRFYGTTARANEIFEANRDVLSAPERLQVGQVLKIPPG